MMWWPEPAVQHDRYMYEINRLEGERDYLRAKIKRQHAEIEKLRTLIHDLQTDTGRGLRLMWRTY